MSHAATTYTFRLRLKPTVKLIALAYADCANQDGTSIWPSIARVVQDTCTSEQTVRRATKFLVDHKLLILVKAAVQHRPVEYRMPMDERHPLYEINRQRFQIGTPKTMPAHARPANLAPLNDSARGAKTQPRGAKIKVRGAIAMAPDPSLDPSLDPLVHTPADASVFALTKPQGDNTMLLQTRFERVWAVYPRGAAKKLAWRVFSRLKPDDALTDRMIAAVQFQKRTVWGGVDPKHIPHLRTWLEQERWTDATDDVAPVGQLELADARRWRQQKFLGRCPHAEACSTDEDCLKVIALRRRAPGTGPSRRDTFQERDRLKAGDDRLEAGDVVPPPVTRSPEESPERDETACPVCGRESCEDVTACLREQHQVFRDLEDVFGPVEFVTVSRCGALHKNA